MKRDAQTRILEACARFLRRGLEPITKRLDEIEQKSMSAIRADLDTLKKEISDRQSISTIVNEAVERAMSEIQKPKNGENGKDGEQGEKGADGAGVADLLIDRDGVLVATFTDGRMKTLGTVIGKDGSNGKDGISLESFVMNYDADAQELIIKASCAGREQEQRIHVAGLRVGGYWRDGKQAKAGEAWVHDGQTWLACKGTTETPSTKSDAWVLAARRGRDGERGEKGADGSPPAPIKIKG